MNVKHRRMTIRDLSAGFVDDDEEGVVAFDGKLDIRPPYQRNWVYSDKQRNAVIKTVKNGFPLNIMYWAIKDNGNFEIIDGQQRTISICRYINNEFSYEDMYFTNLQDDEQDEIYNYELDIYLCDGNDSEKLEWFEIVNIAGEKLTDQELRNAIYSGSWVADAKRYFSKTGGPAQAIGADYLTGSSIRQDYLETAIKWISHNKIRNYMGTHQHDDDAKELWDYFSSVISWIEETFTEKRKNEMKKVDWGNLYNKFKDKKLDTVEIEKEINKLILDDDVTKNSGIYPYVLTRDEKYLSIRVFSKADKLKAFTKQKGKCVNCKEVFLIDEMEADHIDPWHLGGRTIDDNCQLLCKEDNRRKAGK